MSKARFYREAAQYGEDAAFVANLLYLHHVNSHLRLRGLVRLLRQDKRVTTEAFGIDVLLVDGERFPWADLETI